MSHSILDYYLNKDGLSDPNGVLSSKLPSRATCIALANKKVACAPAERQQRKAPAWYIQPVSELTAL